MATNKQGITGNIDYTAASQTMSPSNLSSVGKMPSASPVGEAIGEVVRGAATFIPLAMEAADDNEYNRLYNELDAALLTNTTKGLNKTQNRIFIQNWKNKKIKSGASLSSINKAVQNRPLVSTKTHTRDGIRTVSELSSGEVLSQKKIQPNPVFNALNKTIENIQVTSEVAPQFVRAAGALQKALAEKNGEGNPVDNILLSSINNNVANVHHAISSASHTNAFQLENIEDIEYYGNQHKNSIQNALYNLEYSILEPRIADLLDKSILNGQQIKNIYNSALASISARTKDPTLQSQAEGIGKALVESRERMNTAIDGMSDTTNKDIKNRMDTERNILQIKRIIREEGYLEELRNSKDPEMQVMYKSIMQNNVGYLKAMSDIANAFSVVSNPQEYRNTIITMLSTTFKPLTKAKLLELNNFNKNIKSSVVAPNAAFNLVRSLVNVPSGWNDLKLVPEIYKGIETFIAGLQTKNADGELEPRDPSYKNLIEETTRLLNNYKMKMNKVRPDG